MKKKEEIVVVNVPQKNNQQKKNNKSSKSISSRKGDVRSKSPYFQTLLAPWKVNGYKIPDQITAPSFTTATECRGTLSQVVDGTSTDVVGVAVTVGALGTTCDIYYISASAGGTWTWSKYTFPAQTAGNLSAYSDLSSVASALRPVSAGLTMLAEFADSQDGGRILSAFVPGGSTAVNSASGVPVHPTNINSLLALPYVATIPASRRFAEVRYMPTDPLSMSYNGLAVYPQRTTNTTNAQPLYGFLYMVAEGITKTAGSVFEFSVFENFECLPLKQQSSLASPNVSFSDPIELAMVSNEIGSIADFPVLQSTDDTLAGTSMSWSSGNSLAPNKTGMITKAPSKGNSIIGSVPAAVGLAGYALGKSGMADKVPILGGILRAFGGLS